LDREVLADIVDIALTAGELLMKNGAESQRVEETVRLLGTGLGCDWGSVLVSYNTIMVTHASGSEFRTQIRRVENIGVNMRVIEDISHVAHRVEAGKLDRASVRAKLDQIGAVPRGYNQWVTALAVGSACAAFSRLLGGDWPVFGVALLASGVAVIVRGELAKRGLNALLVVLVTAFAAGGLVGLVSRFQFSPRPELALVASVLFLVPGVPGINAVEDLIKGHIVVGLARAVNSVLIVLAIVLGPILAVQLTGVRIS
jgi:uncharacterized membrane protein YjjP (DUF1212 family)